MVDRALVPQAPRIPGNDACVREGTSKLSYPRNPRVSGQTPGRQAVERSIFRRKSAPSSDTIGLVLR